MFYQKSAQMALPNPSSWPFPVLREIVCKIVDRFFLIFRGSTIFKKQYHLKNKLLGRLALRKDKLSNLFQKLLF